VSISDGGESSAKDKVGVDAYLQLSHDRLAKVLGSSIGAEGDEITSVDMLLAKTALALFGAGCSLTFEPPSFALLPSLAVLKGGIVTVTVAGAMGRNAKEGQVWPAHAIARTRAGFTGVFAGEGGGVGSGATIGRTVRALSGLFGIRVTHCEDGVGRRDDGAVERWWGPR
jgi:hypothetical protein